MAPFVETEWGGDAYEIMKAIKQAVDPNLLLNPGVVINDDADAHIKNLKELPLVEEEVNMCIECGFCEHKCPSRNITTTPRRRIVIRRALKKLQAEGDVSHYNELLRQYQYDVLDTCAVDGLCATACPVNINTGDLVKRLRRENHSAFSNKMASLLAKNFAAAEWCVRAVIKTGFNVNRLFGKNAMNNITRGIKKLIPAMPLWSAQMSCPPGLAVIKKSQKVFQTSADSSIVYFPACITRMMGSYKGQDKNLMQTFMSICGKSGIKVTVLHNANGSCCSQLFSSKGLGDAARFTANDIVQRLWKTSSEGKLPVVTDVSSCAYTLHHIRPVLTQENKNKFDRLTIMDSVDFLYEMVLPSCEAIKKTGGIMLHPVCSLQKMKTENKFIKVAKFFAEEVTVPKHAGCCGMAGDRGFFFPELTESATLPEALEVNAKKYAGYYSSTKTCEMAMSAAVKQNYESILYLADEAIIKPA